jgi:hypothetical protein
MKYLMITLKVIFYVSSRLLFVAFVACLIYYLVNKPPYIVSMYLLGQLLVYLLISVVLTRWFRSLCERYRYE